MSLHTRTTLVDRRGLRFLLEVSFLAGLAAALAFADLRSAEIVGAMLLGWVLVAAVEWASWRGIPHYGSGLPPRYSVPGMSLPPAQPIEQLRSGFAPPARDEAPTWIAPPALQAELLGDWPLAEAAEPAIDDPWLTVEFPMVPLERSPVTIPDLDEVVVEEVVVEEIVVEEVVVSETAAEVDEAAAPVAGSAIEVPAGRPVEPAPAPRPPARLVAHGPGAVERHARHTLDPFADVPRQGWRRTKGVPLRIEVPAEPALRPVPARPPERQA